MKLTKIAISLVAIVGAVAVGGSWYTGKQVEEKYQQLIIQTNNQLKHINSQYGSKVEIKDVQIERHFFSSDAKYRIEIDMFDGEKFDVIGNDTIYHGPLPLNRLAKFNFAPVMMSLENRIQAPEQFKKVVGEQLGSGTTNISYSGDAEGEFALSPVKFSKDKTSVESTPVKIEYSYDKNGENAVAKVQWDKLDVKAEDGNFQIQGISYDIHTGDNQGYANLGLGKGSGKIKTISLQLQNGDGNSLITDIAFKGENTLKGDRVVSTGTLDAASVNIGGIEFGKFNLDMALDFDAQLSDQVSVALSDPKAFENEQTGELALALLAKSVKFHINNVSFENSKGKFDLALLLNVAQFDAKAISDLNSVLKAVATSKFTSSVNRDYAEDIVRQISMVREKLSEEEAKTIAKQQVDAVFANAQENSLRVVDNNKVMVELTVDNGKVHLNGLELSEDELQMALFMIMMGVSSLGH
ncbi:YdgA family protein [Mannheimia glucosida]|uniref:YdgA family protein n=1 Tax=Mannheimia glucosida TaxID=85401 RepID=UPI00391857E5